MKNRLKKVLAQTFQTTTSKSQSNDPFAQIPAFFYDGKSPEQFSAMQQVYREAFERAAQQVLAENRDQNLHWGEGI